MKKFVLLLTLTALLCAPRLQAEENAVRLTRFQGQRITGIVSNCGFDIQLTQGGSTGATVEIDREMEEFLDFSLEKGILRIVLKIDSKNRHFDNWLNNYRLRRATVSVSALDQVSVSSSAKITATGTFNGKNVSIHASSSGRIRGLNIHSEGSSTIGLSSSGDIRSLELTATGDIDLETNSSASLEQFTLTTPQSITVGSSSSGEIGSGSLKADRITLNASSSGKIRDCRLAAESLSASSSSSGTMILSGQVREASFQGSSSGQIEAADLTTTDAKASMSSSASLTLNVTGLADFSCHSSGSIRYSGNPKIQRQQSLSGGHISAR